MPNGRGVRVIHLQTQAEAQGYSRGKETYRARLAGTSASPYGPSTLLGPSDHTSTSTWGKRSPQPIEALGSKLAMEAIL